MPEKKRISINYDTAKLISRTLIAKLLACCMSWLVKGQTHASSKKKNEEENA